MLELEGNAANKWYRRLIKMNAYIKKYTKFNKEHASGDAFVFKGIIYAKYGDSPFLVETLNLDKGFADDFKALTYAKWNCDELFQWEKENKKAKRVAWDNGTLIITSEVDNDFVTYISTDMAQTLIKEHVGKTNMITSLPELVLCNDATELFTLAKTYPSTKLGFKKDGTFDVIHTRSEINEYDNFVQLPHKFLPKIEKSDVVEARIFGAPDKTVRYILLVLQNKQRRFRQFISFIN